jgi:TRAP-type C4-dicarboxylate transport system permease small subunit
MDRLRRLLDGGFRLMDAVMALSMLAMIVIVFANVVLRYGFASGILGSVEISRFLFVWIVMLGAVACLRNDEHLQMLSLVETLPPTLRAVLMRLTQGVIVVCCLMLLLGSVKQTFDNWTNPQPMSGIPVGAVYLAGAVGGALMALVAALKFFHARSERDGDKDRGDAA